MMTINIKTFILGLNLKSCNLQTCFSISYQHINIDFSIRTGWFDDASSWIIAFNQFILISTHAPIRIGFSFVSLRQIEPAWAALHCLSILPCSSLVLWWKKNYRWNVCMPLIPSCRLCFQLQKDKLSICFSFLLQKYSLCTRQRKVADYLEDDTPIPIKLDIAETL